MAGLGDRWIQISRVASVGDSSFTTMARLSNGYILAGRYSNPAYAYLSTDNEFTWSSAKSLRVGAVPLDFVLSRHFNKL